MPPDAGPDARLARRVVALFALGLLVVTVVYLMLAVPRTWFPAAQRLQWGPADMTAMRGHGTARGDEIVLAPADPSGVVVVSINTRLRSSDYVVIDWSATGVPPEAEARLLWRTDYAPARLNALPIKITSEGQLEAVRVDRDPNWLGNVAGLALAIQGASPDGIHVRSVTASAMGAPELLRARLHEWFGFVPWSGTSINTVGVADTQAVSLPVVLFLAAVIATALWFGLNYRRRTFAAFPFVLAVAFVTAWCASDLRWAWNLGRQSVATVRELGNKTLEERHLAAEDGALFAFVQRARTKLPAQPVRIVVAAEAPYFRGRAAYHLYPHNVYFEPYANTLPKPEQLHGGDYLLVYQRRNVQFDPREGRLRWDTNDPVRAELVLADRGAALFRLL